MRTRPHNPDPNLTAARAVRHTLKATGYTPMPANLEEAWTAWSVRVQKSDDRMMLLLKAAFEAGADAAKSLGGRRAGLKGGAARAKALSGKRRAEIAKKAAAARWKNS